MTDEQPPPPEGFEGLSDDDLRRDYADKDGGSSRAADAELNRRQEARRCDAGHSPFDVPHPHRHALARVRSGLAAELVSGM